MIKIVPTTEILLDEFLAGCSRNQLKFHEHTLLSDDSLVSYTKRRTLPVDPPNSFSYIALLNNEPVGLLTFNKDHYDTSIFEIDCYSITELIINPLNQFHTDEIIIDLVAKLLNELQTISVKFYISVGLNANTRNTAYILNSLLKNKFYFIHTLLSFGLQGYSNQIIRIPEDSGLSIREVKPTDVESLCKLAETSFKFSRFHLDPYLDKEKANYLLKKSVENSVLNHFVDIMYVAEIEKNIVGYFSAKKTFIKELNRTFGSAVISAVDHNYRKAGIFSNLNTYILNWLNNNADFSETGTYIANFPVHKTFINQKLPLVRGTHQLAFENFHI